MSWSSASCLTLLFAPKVVASLQTSTVAKLFTDMSLIIKIPSAKECPARSTCYWSLTSRWCVFNPRWICFDGSIYLGRTRHNHNSCKSISFHIRMIWWYLPTMRIAKREEDVFDITHLRPAKVQINLIYWWFRFYRYQVSGYLTFTTQQYKHKQGGQGEYIFRNQQHIFLVQSICIFICFSIQDIRLFFRDIVKEAIVLQFWINYRLEKSIFPFFFLDESLLGFLIFA